MAIITKRIPEGMMHKLQPTDIKNKPIKLKYPKMTGIKKLAPSRIYLRRTTKPIESEIYDIFNIDINTAFIRGFRFNSVDKTDISTVVKACNAKEKVRLTIEEMGVSTRNFIGYLWDILERPNFETVYRSFGLEGLKCLNIYIDPNVLVTTAKRMKKYYKHRSNAERLQVEAIQASSSSKIHEH